jgi:hypothetical protein
VAWEGGVHVLDIPSIGAFGLSRYITIAHASTPM